MKEKFEKLDYIESVESAGNHKSWDLEVEDREHVFYANDILVSNSHSTTYSAISYQTAWLLTYYPLEWYCTILTFEQANSTYGEEKSRRERVGGLEKTLKECAKEVEMMGSSILPVDVNSSEADFCIEGNNLRTSLQSIKGIGKDSAQIVKTNRPYTSFVDFLVKNASEKKISKGTIEALIKVGAFDLIEPNRGRQMVLLSRWLTKHPLEIEVNNKKPELFSNAPVQKKIAKVSFDDYPEKFIELYDNLEVREDLEEEQKAKDEYEYLGFNFRYSSWEVKNRSKYIHKYNQENAIFTYSSALKSKKDEFPVPVIIKEIRERKDKRGKLMAFLTFEDFDGELWDSPCFSYIWGRIKNILSENGEFCIGRKFCYIGIFQKNSQSDDLILNHIKDFDVDAIKTFGNA